MTSLTKKPAPPNAIQLFCRFIELVLENRYRLTNDEYAVFVGEDESTKECFFQFGMNPHNMTAEERQDGTYFDPDLREIIFEFLDDLAECAGKDKMVVDYEGMGAEFPSKMAFYETLYSYTAPEHNNITSTDDIGVVMEGFDPDIENQQLAEALHNHTVNGKKVYTNEKKRYVMGVHSSGDAYVSLDHYFARASVSMCADIMAPLSQILTTICQEEKISLPPELSNYRTPLYNFN